MAKNTVKLTDKQRKERSLLIKKGLYNPKNPRKKPTKYVLSVLNKFADVLTGNASVVSVNPVKVKGQLQTKGVKLAREIAGDNSRTVGNKIIIPVRRELGEHAVLNKKTMEIDIVKTVEDTTYRRTIMRHKIKAIKDIPVLKEGETFAIPFYRGKNRPIDYQNWTYEELQKFYSEYGPGGTKREFIELGKRIQINRAVKIKRTVTVKAA